jgi:hypothetical protein
MKDLLDKRLEEFNAIMRSNKLTEITKNKAELIKNYSDKIK